MVQEFVWKTFVPGIDTGSESEGQLQFKNCIEMSEMETGWALSGFRKRNLSGQRKDAGTLLQSQGRKVKNDDTIKAIRRERRIDL